MVRLDLAVAINRKVKLKVGVVPDRLLLCAVVTAQSVSQTIVSDSHLHSY